MTGKSAAPQMKDTYRTAIGNAVEAMARTGAGPYYGGAEMHKAWAGAIVEPTLDGDAPEVANRRAGLVDPVIWDLAERRWYGSLFLKQAAGFAPTSARDEILSAAADFQAIHDLMYAINREGGAQSPGDKLPGLADREVRKRMADLMLQAAKHDADAQDKLSSALREWQ
jgi:hypothetical protein